MDNKGRNVLFYCITGSDVAMLEHLVTSGVRIQSSTDGITVLMQAVAKQRVDFTKFLVERAAQYNIDINEKDKDGWCAVMYRFVVDSIQSIMFSN